MQPRPPATTDDGVRRIAVLIDADNAQPTVIEGLLAEIARYGVANVKRIYGDFTSNRLQSWKQVLLKHSIHPVQQFAYTSGKNATDSALIIDAMDLMYTGRFDLFCLVSSDSDFTRLAQRLREAGLTVLGFGERKTPDPFVQACDKFIYTEVLRREPAVTTKPLEETLPTPAQPVPAAKSAATVTKPASATAGSPVNDKTGLRDLLNQAIEEASDDSGWAHLGAVGSYLNQLRSDFDPRLYGHRKLSDLVKVHPEWFVIEERGSGGAKAIYVSMRRRARA